MNGGNTFNNSFENALHNCAIILLIPNDVIRYNFLTMVLNTREDELKLLTTGVRSPAVPARDLNRVVVSFHITDCIGIWLRLYDEALPDLITWHGVNTVTIMRIWRGHGGLGITITWCMLGNFGLYDNVEFFPEPLPSRQIGPWADDADKWCF